jgi:hypothetical protein
LKVGREKEDNVGNIDVGIAGKINVEYKKNGRNRNLDSKAIVILSLCNSL